MQLHAAIVLFTVAFCVVAHGAVSLRVERPVDDPQACPWDIRICTDGTWVYRQQDHNCSFRACWSSPPTLEPSTVKPADPDE